MYSLTLTLILTQFGEVRCHYIHFITVETGFGCWLIPQQVVRGFLASLPIALKHALFFLTLRFQNPPHLQLKLQEHFHFSLPHPATQPVFKKNNLKHMFYFTKKEKGENVISHSHPLTNYKLLEYKIKRKSKQS